MSDPLWTVADPDSQDLPGRLRALGYTDVPVTPSDGPSDLWWILTVDPPVNVLCCRRCYTRFNVPAAGSPKWRWWSSFILGHVQRHQRSLIQRWRQPVFAILLGMMVIVAVERLLVTRSWSWAVIAALTLPPWVGVLEGVSYGWRRWRWHRLRRRTLR